MYRRGLEYLIKHQMQDGSWHVESRSKPFQLYFETGYPHGKDQFISTTAACWATLALLHALPQQEPEPIETLAGTQPIEWPESDLSGRLMVGAHQFVDSRIKLANEERRELKLDEDSALYIKNRIANVARRGRPPFLAAFGTVRRRLPSSDGRGVAIIAGLPSSLARL